MPEAKACKLMIPYLYIQGCDETQKMLEKFKTQIDLGIDGQDEDDGTDNIQRRTVSKLQQTLGTMRRRFW